MLLDDSYNVKASRHSDAQHRPQGMLAGDEAGIGSATSGSFSDRLTRDHRMTFDEAQQILNVKQGDPVETILRVRTRHDFQAGLWLTCIHLRITNICSKLIHLPHLLRSP